MKECDFKVGDYLIYKSGVEHGVSPIFKLMKPPFLKKGPSLIGEEDYWFIHVNIGGRRPIDEPAFCYRRATMDDYYRRQQRLERDQEELSAQIAVHEELFNEVKKQQETLNGKASG